MTRIIAGSARSRRLDVPAGATRPTADRAREALFSSIADELPGARFLDLYAGSGAVGLEAASRGAGEVLLVEASAKAKPVLDSNITVVGASGVNCVIGAVETVVAKPADRPFDIVFADPPYALPDNELLEVLAQLSANGWLTTDALIVLERASRDTPWKWPVRYVPLRNRRYGEGTLWYGRHGGVATTV